MIGSFKTKRLLSLFCATALLLSSVILPNVVSLKADEIIDVWDGTSDSSLEGAGTADNPYLIKTGAQLYYVTHTTDKTTFDKYYKLVNDIYLNDISDENWYRSESVNKWAGGDTHFGGIFDGDGHVVYGLYTDSENASYSKGGLFPRVYGYNGVTSKQIVIKNLGIEQSYILNSVYSGVIVGQLTGGGGSADLAVAVTIENCYADETVTVSGTKYVGGLVGLLDFKGSFSMNNCYSKVQFGDYPSGWNANEEERNGSLIGWLQNTTESGYTRTVSNCYVVLRREDYEKGYNAVPNITDSVKDSITYTNVHSTNGENSGVQTQHGNAVAGLTSGHWSSDFKGAVAKTKLPAFDWENTWVEGKTDSDYPSLKVFANGSSGGGNGGESGGDPDDNEPEVNDGDPEIEALIWDGTSNDQLTGSGTEEDPYIITEPEQLYYVVFKTTNRATYGKYYKLANDIYLNNYTRTNWQKYAKAWQAPGNELNGQNNTDFGGVLDGDGHVVYGLYVNNMSTGYYKGGLIPRIFTSEYMSSDVVIKNIGIEHSELSAALYCGAIVGQIDGRDASHSGASATQEIEVRIENCYVANTVQVKSGKYVSGIVGLVGHIGTFTLDNCYSAVTFDGFPSSGDNARYGSLIGDIQRSTGTRNISNSYAVLRYTDYEVGFNALPNLSDGNVKKTLSVTNVHSANTEVDEPSQRGDYSSNADFNRNSSDFKGAAAKTILPNFDWEGTWSVGADDDHYMYLTEFGARSSGVDAEEPDNNYNDGLEGSGTKEDPYRIEDEDGLAILRGLNSVGSKDKYYVLTQNITVQNAATMSSSASFNGYFDGQGYTISGLEITNESGEAALFTKLGRKGTVKNLVLEDCTFIGRISGAVAARIGGEYATIENCFVKDSVTVKASKYAGGIVGLLGSTYFTLHNCAFVGNVQYTGDDANHNAGGLIGGIESSANSATTTLSSSYAVTKNDDKVLNFGGSYTNICFAGVYTNVEFPTEKIAVGSDIVKLTTAQMKGSDAEENMTLFDFSGNWKTKLLSTPVLRFGDDIPDNAGSKGKVWTGKIAKNYASGTGAVNDPYIIETPEQLALMAYTSVQNPVATSGVYYKLTADIKLNDTSASEWYEKDGVNEWFYGYGYRSVGFLGYFDGNGYTVDGICYKNIRNTKSYGLIHTVGGSCVVEKVAVKNLYSTTGDGSYGTLGAISGFVSRSANTAVKPTIRYCISDSSNIYATTCTLGGILGHACMGVKIENCLSLAEIPYKSNRGTILGTSDTSTSSVEITNCVAIQDTSGRGYLMWASESAKAVDPEITNVYVTYSSNGLVVTPRSKMIGDKAKANLTELDWNNVWMTVDNATPTLRVFEEKGYWIDNKKVTISFFTDGGTEVDDVTGYPGEKIPMPTNITRDADELEGWYLENLLLRKFNIDVFPEYDVVLFAKWNVKTISQDFEKYPYYISGEEGIGSDIERFRPGSSGFSFNKVNDGLTSVHRKGTVAGEQDFLLFQEDFEPLEIGQEYTMTFSVYVESINDANDIIKLIHTDYLDINELPYQIDEICTLGSLKTGHWQEITVKFIANGYYLSIRTPGLSSLYFDSFRIVPTNTGFKYTNVGNSSDSSSSIIVNTGTNTNINNVNDTDNDNNSDNSNAKTQKKKKLIKVVSYGGMDLTFLYWLIPVAVVVLAAGAVLIAYFVKKKRK